MTDLYLSGNIYEKLDAVKGKLEFKEQEEMLQKVLPTPKGAADINVKLGANYIEPKYIEQFARDVLNSRLTIRKDVSGRWIIEGVRQSRYGDIVNVKYGCNAFNAVQLLEKVLNDGEITATKKVGTGKEAVTVPDLEMTDIARQKADDIRAAFDSWIFRDSDRRNDIVGKYNRMYNNYRPFDYNRIAEKLSFDSMDSVLKEKLYPHQKNGIARFLFDGNILFAHGVGTGKTFEMIASVMEARRMGIINKAAMVVPNNKVVDFKRDISQAYPNAKVLVIDTANKKRQTMLGLVNSNDWDIVLIAKPTFTKIPVSRQMQAHYVAQQLEDLQVQISEAESDRNVSKRQLKGLIAQRDNFEQKLKDLNSDTKRDENSIDFEKLGIDCICVDEAHNYKSIMTPTKLDIEGLVNRNNAQVANDMLMKLDYIRSIDGRIIFGTGTPITNTASEIYNMMRMGHPDILESAGIHSLDEWINTFAKIETTTEIGIDNQIKTKSTQVIRSFVNTSEMIGMFRQFADVVFTQDVVKNLPKAKYIDIEIPGTPEHKRVQNQVSKVIATTKKSELLKAYGQVMAMADAASVDLRMLSGAESEYNVFKNRTIDELEYENSKINKMCDIVFDEYTKSNNIKGTQIIFCDKGSGSGTVYSFNLHKDIMQKLISKGIPKDEIVIIKNQSDAQLESLYDKVNEGEVRVIIGTSQKMAEGLNVQKRVVAIHHPTVTYKPSDWEQGNARGVRAGNINNEVRIYRYLQENTFDSHKWQAQDRKSEMINKALRDLGTAYKLSAINNPVEFAIKYLKAFGGVITNSKDYKQYKAMGGGHSSELTANIEDISKTLRMVAQKDMGKARRLAYSIFLHPVDTIAVLNDMVESTPRFMEFQRTLKDTGDLQEAIYNADDITTNFKRSGNGTTAKAVNKIIMFNNAAIQGLDKMFRTVTEKDTKKRVKTLIKWLIHALLIGAVEYIYNKQVDDEGYKNLSSYKKNNFYNFAIGDGEFITLPKPRENAILDTFTEIMIEYSLDGDKEAFYDFGGYLGLQLLPPMIPDTLNPVDAVHSVGGSTIFGGLIDVGFNKDFKGAPIESEYDKDSPSNERYTESTTKLAYRLGQTKLARDNDMSPKKIDHLISSYTGILGQVNKALFPMSENRVDKTIGLRNKFVSDSNYSTDVLNKLYDNRDVAERNFKYYNTIEKAVEYEKNAVITSYISGMNKSIKALPYDKQRDGRILLLKDLNNW